MKLLGALVATASLVFGSLAASTFYYPYLAEISAAEELTLSAPAGLKRGTVGVHVPLLEAGTVLTQEKINLLTEHEVTRVRIKEITSKWPEWTMFIASLLGFGAATLMMRTRRPALEGATDGEAFGAGMAPGQALEQLARGLVKLSASVQSATDDQSRVTTILRGVEELQRDFLEPFVESRERLIQKLGMSRFAQVMDRFAVCERRLNRAWSSAADHVMPEALACLEEAQEVLTELRDLEDWASV